MLHAADPAATAPGGGTHDEDRSSRPSNAASEPPSFASLASADPLASRTVRMNGVLRETPPQNRIISAYFASPT
jgi:hypothetical protein